MRYERCLCVNNWSLRCFLIEILPIITKNPSINEMHNSIQEVFSVGSNWNDIVLKFIIYKTDKMIERVEFPCMISVIFSGDWINNLWHLTIRVITKFSVIGEFCFIIHVPPVLYLRNDMKFLPILSKFPLKRSTISKNTKKTQLTLQFHYTEKQFIPWFQQSVQSSITINTNCICLL